MLRDLNCVGLSRTTDTPDAFRNENVAAKQGSEKARRGRKPKPERIPLEILTTPSTPGSSRLPTTLQETWPREPRSASAHSTEHPTGPLPRAVVTRAVERLFVSWVSSIPASGRPASRSDVVITLYSTTLPGSVLWFAVHALAVAELSWSASDCINGCPGPLVSYGNFLKKMQTVLLDQEQISSDESLVAFLVIGIFEVSVRKNTAIFALHLFFLDERSPTDPPIKTQILYLGRYVPLESHAVAVQYALRSRNAAMKNGKSLPSASSAAYGRLQAWALLSGSHISLDDTALAGLTDRNLGSPTLAKIHAQLKLTRAASILATNKPYLARTTFAGCGLKQLAIKTLSALNYEELSNELNEFERQRRHAHQTSTVHSPSWSYASSPIPKNSIPSMCRWILHSASRITASDAVVTLLLSLDPTLESRALFSQGSAALATHQMQHQLLCTSMIISAQHLLEACSTRETAGRLSPQMRSAMTSSSFLVGTTIARSPRSTPELKQAANELLRTMHSGTTW